MFEIKVENVEALQRKLDQLNQQVLALHDHIPKELVEWQTTDMRRKFPNIAVIHTPSSLQAETRVWPRSRLDVSGPGVMQSLEPGFKRPAGTVKTGPTVSSPRGMGRRSIIRPILRVNLLRRLYDRMIDVAGEALKWP